MSYLPCEVPARGRVAVFKRDAHDSRLKESVALRSVHDQVSRNGLGLYGTAECLTIDPGR
jgi:hypothetical protein